MLVLTLPAQWRCRVFSNDVHLEFLTCVFQDSLRWSKLVRDSLLDLISFEAAIHRLASNVCGKLVHVERGRRSGDGQQHEQSSLPKKETETAYAKAVLTRGQSGMIADHAPPSVEFERLIATDMFLKRYVYRMAEKERMIRERQSDPDVDFWNGLVSSGAGAGVEGVIEISYLLLLRFLLPLSSFLFSPLPSSFILAPPPPPPPPGFARSTTMATCSATRGS